jgi:hypothetical protein
MAQNEKMEVTTPAQLEARETESSDVKMQAKGRGRPAQNGAQHPRILLRSLLLLYFYDKARSRGEKYSMAISETVAQIQQLHPGLPISAACAKRALAEFRAKGAPTTIMVESSIVEGEEAREIRRKLAFRGFLSDTGVLSESQAEPTRVEDDSKPLKRLRFRFAKNPDYPRHNAKNSESSEPQD